MNYPSMRIEGAILSPDIVERLDDMSGQKASDFGFKTGTKVKDEIARAWADAQDYWRIFQRKLETLRPEQLATTETRNNWIVPLLGLLKYDLEFQKSGTEVHGKIYAISHRVTNRGNTPVQIVGYQDPAGLDKKPANATLRMSAHALVQQYLNLNDELYGIVTNGRVIRLLRDSSRLIKQSYLEFDLDRIFNDGLYADFAILFRLLHASRLPHSSEAAAESLIEKYHQDSLDSGARIREGLSEAVENAIKAFGNGFLAHPDNTDLRESIAAGDLDAAKYYRSLLGLIYRLLFLMVIEERGLVFPDDTPKAQREIYTKYYSVQRLRNLAEKRYLADKRHHDLWQALLSTFHLFEADGPGEKIGLKPLAGDLFSPAAIAAIFNCRLGNDVLLGCLRSLGLYEHPDTRQMIRVNYAALNVEEFGSVYEGLLKYTPQIVIDGISAEFLLTPGPDVTQSHYTPDDLVQPLIKHSLDYLIEDRLKMDDRETALLDLRVADIACGSGHILLAAARRIATELAVVRTGEEQPSPTAYRKALRDVIRNCIFGVDLNPLAVELCKVALWLEAHNPGEPLGFLDHHIKCGNAIVGFVSREEVDNGVPEEAFVRMPDDEPEFAKAVRLKNKNERKDRRQQSLTFTEERRGEIATVLERWRTITAMDERTPADIDAKKVAFERFSRCGAVHDLGQIASIPIAQFFVQKTPENSNKLITDAEFRDYWSGKRRPKEPAFAVSNVVDHEKKLFHWFLEFPGVMVRGGFDCILGNPPYLGGTKISTQLGTGIFNSILYLHNKIRGHADLVAYFFDRALSLVCRTGFIALITTDRITQGDTRSGTLEAAVNAGASIVYGKRSLRWPGQAAVHVSLLSISKSVRPNIRPMLDDRRVESIQVTLEEGIDLPNPIKLASNVRVGFAGSYVYGEGFVLSSDEASRLVEVRSSNVDVVRPFLIGDDINQSPTQVPSRFVIDFRDWGLDRSRRYPECFSILEDRVKPIRDPIVARGRQVHEVDFWKFWDKRLDKYALIDGLRRVIALARTGKHASFTFTDPTIVYSDDCVIFISEEGSVLANLQSSIHFAWIMRHCTMRGTTIRYSVTNVLNTFPFVDLKEPNVNQSLILIGEQYHEHRQQLMLMLWLGLTKIYNLFHDPELSVEMVADVSGKDDDIAREGYEGLLELRRLHVKLDNAVRDAYGWHDLDLGHDFHEVETLPENDRTRYTISPTARKEVLKRLLALNHQRAGEEESKAAAAKPAKNKRGNKSSVDKTAGGDDSLLLGGPLFDR